MNRHQPACSDNNDYLAYVRHSYLTRLKENLPKTLLEKDSWLTPPPILQDVSDALVSEGRFLKKYHIIEATRHPYAFCRFLSS